jgi:hypothetical protein
VDQVVPGRGMAATVPPRSLQAPHPSFGGVKAV